MVYQENSSSSSSSSSSGGSTRRRRRRRNKFIRWQEEVSLPEVIDWYYTRRRA